MWKQIGSDNILPVVVLNSDGSIAESGSVSLNSTTMQNAVSATGNGATLDVAGKSVAVIEITGTFSAIVSFEASSDDANWFAINATQIGQDVLSTIATVAGLYRLSVAGIKSIRARVTWTSGTSLTAKGHATLADSHAKVVTPIARKLTNATSGAYEASRVLLAQPGFVFGLTGYNSKTSVQFIQLHDSATLPADAAVPGISFPVAAQSPFSLDFGFNGRYFTNGAVICNSSTDRTKTIGSADCSFDAQVI